ncbi:hypothetical protein AAVH_15155 [Aphelenchoides avenae]|nr:hypothetical protein AAVH_15155 [Aphelenchus avenae]
MNDYDAGSLEDGTAYLLSRAQAADSVNYLCENEQDRKMIFNNTWYCYFSYTLEASEMALGEGLLSGDYCSKWFGATTHVLKISEPREYEWLARFFGRTGAIHLGAILLSGTTYTWYDGNIARDLPWSSGAPLGVSNTVVQIVSSGYTVEDTEPRMTRLQHMNWRILRVYDPVIRM